MLNDRYPNVAWSKLRYYTYIYISKLISYMPYHSQCFDLLTHFTYFACRFETCSLRFFGPAPMCFTALQIASKEIAATWLQRDGICHENNAPWRRFNWITSQMEIEWNYSNMIYIYIVIIDYNNLNQIIMRFPSVQLFWLKHVETSNFLIQVEGAIAQPCCSMLVNQYLIRWPFIGW